MMCVSIGAQDRVINCGVCLHYSVVPEPRCSCPQSPTNGFTTGCIRPGRGNLVTYNCYYGYDLVGGDKTRRCLPGGYWSGSTPYCSRASTTSPTFTTGTVEE